MTPDQLHRYFLERVEPGDHVELNYAFVHIPGEVLHVTERHLHLRVKSRLAPGVRRYDLRRICRLMIELVHRPQRGEPTRITVNPKESPRLNLL
jgi:hypothetical protein